MNLSKVVLGMQSFRCSEVVFSLSPNAKALLGGLYGVEYTQIGYCGGKKLHPSYRRIGDHTEVVEVHYNPKLISISDILEVFFENHDYTALFPTRYRSSVFYTEDIQKDEAEYFIRNVLVGSLDCVDV